MAGVTYVSLPLNVGVATNDDAVYVQAKTGIAISANQLFVPYDASFVPPANATRCEILTPGAYFYVPGGMIRDERFWQQRDLLTIVDASLNASLGVFSFQQNAVLIKVMYP